MKVDLLELLEKQLRNIGIQTILLKKPYENLEQTDYGFRKKMFRDYRYDLELERMKQVDAGIIIEVLTSDFQNYLFVRFPEGLQEEYDCEYLCIGPYLYQPITNAMFQTVIERYQIPQEQIRDIQEYFNMLPIVSYIFLHQAILDPLLTGLLGEDYTTRHIDCVQNPGSISEEYSEYQIQPSSEVSLSLIAERYENEDAFLRQVTLGNIDESLRLYNQFLQFRIEPRSFDTVRNMKNLLVIMNTLLRKAAQAGRVHPFHIDNLSSEFAKIIESTDSESKLDVLPHTMIRKYCLLVKNYSRIGNSSVVQLSLDYIDANYQDSLTLDLLAKLCNVTGSYLSTVFKKETGVTVTDYIHKTRVRQSLILLNTTSLSIQEIAQRCGYSDVNYFIRTFKKYQQLTPKAYRKMIQENGT
jgi:AraC-like DNA-binding protein